MSVSARKCPVVFGFGGKLRGVPIAKLHVVLLIETSRSFPAEFGIKKFYIYINARCPPNWFSDRTRNNTSFLVGCFNPCCYH